MIPRKRTVCNDGTSLSIQVGRNLYCIPREDDEQYTAVEVGFILDSEEKILTPPEEWKEYGDGSDFPCDVYGYVPIELVEKFINSHGGRRFYV